MKNVYNNVDQNSAKINLRPGTQSAIIHSPNVSSQCSACHNSNKLSKIDTNQCIVCLFYCLCKKIKFSK